MAVDAEPLDTAQVGGGSVVDAEPLDQAETEGPAKVKKPKAQEFEEQPVISRAIQAPTGALESAGRAVPNLITGTLGQGLGSIYGLATGENLDQALETGGKVAKFLHIDPKQKSSAYFDEQIAKGTEFVREWLGEEATSAPKYKKLEGQTLESLKAEAVNRGIAEGIFDNIIIPALIGRMIPRGRPALETPAGEQPIKPGPTGPQGELFSDERVQPQTLEGQPVQSQYNIPEIMKKQIERELNPDTERRAEGQGELFTDYNPAEKYTVEPPQGGGRFREPDMSKQVTHDIESTKGLGGATEQSNLSADLFKRDLPAKDEPIPFEPMVKPLGQTMKGRKQGGAMDPDLLTFGVRKLLDSEGFHKVMERFRGTFSDVAVDHALRQSTDPKSRETVVFMSPDKFLQLAMKRDPQIHFESWMEHKRQSIREGIDKKGLNDIPTLNLEVEGHFTPGAAIHQVWSHEGRHRADVFKERGVDLMPVLVKHSDLRWGEKPIEDFPQRVISEDGKFIEFPAPEFWGKDNLPSLDFTSPNKGKFGQGGGINLGLFSKSPAKAALDSKKQFAPDERKLSELGLNPQIKDIPASFKAATNALIDKSVSILSEKYGQVGELLKWTVDNIKAIDRNSLLQLERDLFGEQYKAGSGGIYQPFEKRQRGPEGALTLWKNMRSNRAGRAELREMVDKAIDNIGRDMSPDEFRTPRQYEAYKALQQALTNKLAEVNAERAKNSMKPIDRLPGYLPAFWHGDYRVHVYDGLGNKKMSFGFKTEYGANYAAKKLREAHPDMDVRDAEHVKIDRTQIGDLSAFEEAIRALGKNDPVALALQRTMVELRASKGFGRHGLQRKGVLGFLGMESGDLGVRNMESSIEQYFGQANRYISNMKKARVMAEIDNLPLEVREKAPRALEYIHDYVANSRGANIDQAKFVTNLVEGLSEIAGTGRSTPRQLVNKTSAIASLYMLTTGRFVLSQIPQHLNAFSKFVQLNVEGNFGQRGIIDKALFGLVNPTVAVMKGWHHFILPDEIAKRAVNWAQRNGYLESALVQMLEMKLGDVTFERSKLLKDAVNMGMGKLEKAVVRMPSLLAFEYGLRDAIKDEGLRFKTAAEMMDYYMVNYNQTGRPLMYSKLGLVGDSLKTFKQYSHNGWAQFFEYLRYVSQEGGDIRPLVSHMAMQTTIAGLKGTVLVAEATAAIKILNMILPATEQIPDPQDLLMKSKLHDVLVYGGLSTALGVDISSSVNAPNIPQMFSAPAWSFGKNIIKDVGAYLMNRLTGTQDEQDEMKAALAVAPAAMRGWIEEMYTKPGQPVTNPNAHGGKGDYIRKGNDNWWQDEHFLAKWLSVRTINEARERAMISATKHDLAIDMNAKISYLDAIVDRIQSGNAGNMGELVQGYVKEGGDPNKLAQAIQKRMQERQMDYVTRQVYNKQLTPNQIHKLEAMKELLDRRSKQSPKSQVDAEEVGLEKQQGTVYNPNMTDTPEFAREGQISSEAATSEVDRRRRVIEKKLGEAKARRYNPVEEEMTDKEKDKYQRDKLHKYRETLRKKRILI